MLIYKFRSQIRLMEFWNNIKDPRSYEPQQLFYLLGWLLIFSFFCFSWGTGFVNSIPLLLILIYFWHQFSNTLSRKLHVPEEIWIIGYFILGTVEYSWLSVILDTEVSFQNLDSLPGIAPTLLQIILLSFLILLLNFTLTQGKRQKTSHFILFMALIYASASLLRLSDQIFWQLFQIILLLILFRYTSWVESLTKAENWLYLFIIFLLYFSFSTIPTLNSLDFTAKSFVWYYLPKILSHFFKLYLLAVLLKIPFVLVYHHASLKRKFQIAGWLQSSIPQFIQLIILVLVFYFFISSWQAEHLKNALLVYLENNTSRTYAAGQITYKIEPDKPIPPLIIPGHSPVMPAKMLPNFGVLKLPQIDDQDGSNASFFIVYRPEQDTLYQYHFVQIDSTLLEELNRGLSYFLANGLLAYPFTIQNWDSNFYKVRIWQGEQKYRELNTFPFAMIPYKSDHILKTDVRLKTQNQDKDSSRSRIKIFNQEIFTAGRLYSSLYNSRLQQTGYYAFDAVIFLSWSFFGSPLMKQILFWLIIYVLINLLIIQRVIKFGNQITQRIIQKFNQLTLGIRQVSGGNLNYRIKMEGEDEFVELADRFNRMGSELQKNISELRDKDRLEHELRIARDVQLGLLPKNLPQIKNYQITAQINTATEVGGDFYDMIPLSAGKFLFVIGDVSGKGTSAAFYMAQCISLLRFACQFTDNPREILLRLNRYFSDPMIDKQIFVTTVIGVLDTRKHQITILRAGHNHPILISGKGGEPVKEIQLPGLGIGLEREGTLFEKTIKSKVLRLGKGDALFLYTDGLVEASVYVDEHITDPEKVSFFGEERLIEIISKAQERGTPDLIRDINDEVRSFYGQSPLIDDLTMLLIQREK